MKNLITICGKWSSDFQLKFLSFIEYVPFDLKDCDIIIASDRKQNIDWLENNNSIQVLVINDCDNQKLFSYKCLEYANHEKDKYELETGILHNLCFFVDANDIYNIEEFPKKFIYPQDREVITFDSKKLYTNNKNFSEYVTIVSTSCWYSNSFVFNIISKYYKGNQFLNNEEKWKGVFGYVNEEITFFNYIRKLGFTFIYLK
jgi:hypothetical protein